MRARWGLGWLVASSLAAACGGGSSSNGGPGDGGMDATADSGGGPDGSGGTPEAGGGETSSPDDASSGPDASATPDSASSPDADAGAPPEAGSVDADCSPSMTYGGGEMSVAGTKTVTAKIVDETGAPVSGQPVFICGLDICSAPSMTDMTGAVTISTTLSEKKPAFKVGDTLNYNEFAIPLTQASTDFTQGGTAVLTLGALSNKPGAALTPGTSATSGDVTIDVPAGTTVGIDQLAYPTASEQELRTVSIPLASDGPVLASSGVTGFGLLYGLAPAETPVCPPVKVTVQLPHVSMMPNDLGWAPGSAVEFWIMTIDTGQTYAPYAGWAKASDGVVSADGKSVSTASGQGLIFLESFAIRKP